MMTPFRRVALASLAALVLASVGCLEVDTIFTVYPDGSGRVTMSMTIDEDKLEMLRGMAPGGLEETQGSGPTQEIGGLVGRQKLRITTEGLFEDINQVQMSGLKISFQPGGDNTFRVRLEVDPKSGPGGSPTRLGPLGGLGGGSGRKPLPPDDGQDPENLTEDSEGAPADPDAMSEDAAQAMAEQMLAGMKMRVQVILPNEVLGSTGKHEGRRAWLTLDEKTMKAAREAIVLEASCEDRLGADAMLEFAEFQTELAGAKSAAAAAKDGGARPGKGK